MPGFCKKTLTWASDKYPRILTFIYKRMDSILFVPVKLQLINCVDLLKDLRMLELE